MSSLPKIKATGDFFQYEAGGEFFYAGASEFGDWKRFCMDSGPEALVRPNLIERKIVRDNAGYAGPCVNRVFRYSHPNNPFGMPATDPRQDFAKINQFLAMCAEYNVYVDWTCGDSQFPIVGVPTVPQQQAWLDNFCLHINHFCFMETCNEPFKNGQLPENGVKSPLSPWYLRDSGYYVFMSDTVMWDTSLDLDFVSIHHDRTNSPIRWPRWVCDADDSIASLRSNLSKPAVLKEPNKFGPYYSDPSYAKCLGLRTNMGGTVFHSQKGLESNGYDEATRVAAGEYWKGVKGALS